ncbi:hypothetical protein AA958_11910 [Streptomyces sp. CNQ-509]|nr:hypothetical protein AA958_11910 [Streptomyces sp. CNQ-509]
MTGAVRRCGATVTASAGSGELRPGVMLVRLTRKLDILRLTTRGLERLRRVGSRRTVISRSPSGSAAARCSGGMVHIRAGYRPGALDHP